MLNKSSYLLSIAVLLAACEGSDAPTDATGRLSVWAHAGQAAERATLEEQVARFDAAQPDLAVDLTFVPERTYNAQLQAAAIAGDLPDVLELDGPFVANYAWQGHLVPLDTLLAEQTRSDLLPSILAQGNYRGRLYAVGTFDSGLALYARRSVLDAAGARVPLSPDEAWTVSEFDRLLQRLAAGDPDGAVLDLKLNYPDEWFSYALSPLLQSAGGDLIERDGYQTAAGVLNGPEALAAMSAVQNWLYNGWVDPNVDDAAFVSGRVALSLAGHWEYRRYRDALGEDLALLPLPDLGHGSRTGQGSWVWSVSENSRDPQAAARFIEFLLEPEEVLKMADANGAVPATRTAVSRSPWYGPGGELRLFVTQLAEGYAVPRPATPAYPVISSAFRRAFADIRDGAPVQEALDRAVQVIDRDVRDNQGYAPAPRL